MNIVMFGEDIYSATVLQSLVDAKLNVQLVICPYYKDEHINKGVKGVAEKAGVRLMVEKDVNSEAVRSMVQQLKPDLILSVHLRKILKKEIFSLASKGAINIHPSLLPKYRGLSPQHQGIMHGDRESGVTVHFIEEGIDTGDIIAQRKFEIKNDDYIFNVQMKMLAIYKELVVEAINLLEEENFKPKKQDLTHVSFFGPLRKEDRRIDLARSKAEVYNLVRAVSKPYPGAFVDNYVIWHAYIPDAGETEELKSKYPGSGIIPMGEDELLMYVKDGVVVADDFEPIE